MLPRETGESSLDWILQNPNAETFREEENQGGLRSSREETRREGWDVTKILTFPAPVCEALGLGSNDGHEECYKIISALPFGISLGYSSTNQVSAVL